MSLKDQHSGSELEKNETPVPWYAKGGSIYKDNPVQPYPLLRPSTAITKAGQRANAALIVEAVNAYDTLKTENAALREEIRRWRLLSQSLVMWAKHADNCSGVGLLCDCPLKELDAEFQALYDTPKSTNDVESSSTEGFPGMGTKENG